MDGLRLCQVVYRRLAHGHLLCFFLCGGLLRERLEFAGGQLADNVQRLVTGLAPPAVAAQLRPAVSQAVRRVWCAG